MEAPQDNSNLKEVASKISVARYQMVKETPFFGICSANLKIIPVSERLKGRIKTAAVTPTGICMYNPDFVSKLSFRETKGLLAHEALHPALNFWGRFDLRDIDIANRAHDYAINVPIVDTPEMDLPKGGLFKDEYRGKSAEEIFFILEEEKRQKKSKPKDGKQGGDDSGDNNGNDPTDSNQGEGGNETSEESQVSTQKGSKGEGSEQGEQDKNNGKGGSSNDNEQSKDDDKKESSGESEQGDDYTLEGDVDKDIIREIEQEYYNDARGKDVSEDEMSEIRKDAEQRWLDTLQQAYVAEKNSGKGNLPAWMVAEIEGILFPKMDFKRLLKRFFGRFGTPARPSFKHRNRRNTFLPNTFVKPKLIESLPRLYVLIDTSGSMWNADGYKMVQGALGLIKRLANNDQYDIQIIMADTCVKKEMTFAEVMKAVKEKKLQSIGGGGSSFVSSFERIWELAAKENMSQAPILCITDGFIDVPKKEAKMMTATAWITPPHVTPPTNDWGHHMEMDV